MKTNCRIAITKFEQSALVLRTENTQLAIDFGGLTPKLPTITGRVDGAIVSHVHGDHFNVDHLRSLGAPVWAATEVVQRLGEANILATLLDPGKTVYIGDFKLTPVVVDHGSISAPIANFGLIIQSNGATIFFTGDMAVPLTFPVAAVDVLIVPVGGGKVFSAEEAANYVAANKHHGRVVPVHYHGQADPASALKFQELVGAGASVAVLEVGESLEVGK
jgi:L-ascorbate metabolism protein UlaG (beta-lactamase superfamily)